jgi:hypothetical protein
MSENNTPSLAWEEGAGWLVFSGAVDALSEVRAQALNRMIPEGDIVYIGVNEDSAEELIDDMGELGAPTGFLVNVLTEDDNSIMDQVSAAALIVIPDEIDPRDMQSVLSGVALEAIKIAYQLGAVVLIEGSSTMIFGKVYAVDDIGYDGFDWVRDALILPDVVAVAESELAREALNMEAANVAIGVGAGSALVLGRGGSIEAWGEKQVSVLFSGRRIDKQTP